MKRFLLVLFLIVSLSSWSYATTYYVDNTITDTHVASATPDCSNYDPSTFACSGGFASAYATVADINAGSFSAGDQILFRKGQTWHEQFTLPSVGSSGNPITVSSFGSGAQPMFDGADVQATWTSESLGGAANLTCDANLQGYWYFENNLNDSTSHGNTLTGVSSPGFSNTTVKQGSYSLGALNGSSQYAYRDDRDLSAGFVGKDGTTNTAITFGAWVYATSFTNWGPAISKVGGGLSYGLKVVRNPGIWQWRFMVTLDSTERDMDSDSDAVLNAWTHMVGRVDPVSKKAEFFINGVKQTASYSATSTTIGTSTSRLNIGYASGGYLTGYIDEAFVFNRALSDTEIQGIYNYGFAGGGNTTTVYHTNTGTYSSDPLQAFQIDGSTVTRIYARHQRTYSLQARGTMTAQIREHISAQQPMTIHRITR